MFQKGCDDIESGLGLEHDLCKKNIQDSARLCGVYLQLNFSSSPALMMSIVFAFETMLLKISPNSMLSYIFGIWK
jgi:hypothetical protein